MTLARSLSAGAGSRLGPALLCSAGLSEVLPGTGMCVFRQALTAAGCARPPTEKPVNLLSYLLERACPMGGLVLDPFAGSGATLVAAKQLGLRAVGVEFEERYFEAAVRRLEASGSAIERAAWLPFRDRNKQSGLRFCLTIESMRQGRRSPLLLGCARPICKRWVC